MQFAVTTSQKKKEVVKDEDKTYDSDWAINKEAH